MEETCDAVEGVAGERPLGIVLDVADSAAVDAACDEAAGRHGRIDVLVTNAGIELLHTPEHRRHERRGLGPDHARERERDVLRDPRCASPHARRRARS